MCQKILPRSRHNFDGPDSLHGAQVAVTGLDGYCLCRIR